jgi:hypothetical protein
LTDQGGDVERTCRCGDSAGGSGHGSTPESLRKAQRCAVVQRGQEEMGSQVRRLGRRDAVRVTI